MIIPAYVKKTLAEAVAALLLDDRETCKQRLMEYWQARNKGAEEPVTPKTNVRGDAIANSVLTLLNASVHTDDDINTHPSEKCDDC
jgi:hypothetical protein